MLINSMRVCKSAVFRVASMLQPEWRGMSCLLVCRLQLHHAVGDAGCMLDLLLLTETWTKGRR